MVMILIIRIYSIENNFYPFYTSYMLLSKKWIQLLPYFVLFFEGKGMS